MDRPARLLCPNGNSTTCFRLEDQEPFFIAGGCRRWDCPTCAISKRATLVRKIVSGKPSRLITLTCRHEHEPSTQLATMRKAFQHFVADMRQTVGEFEYIRVLEECCDGFPHFHLLARCAFVPQPQLKALWRKHTGAEIVDVRKAHGKSLGYVSKYLGKAFGTNKLGLTMGQRVAASHNFYGKLDNNGDEYISFEHHRMHPVTYAADHYGTSLTLERIRWGLYHVHEREPGDDFPEELQPRFGSSATASDHPGSMDDDS